MRIRDLINSFRARRIRQLNDDSVSFEAFCNEPPIEKYPAMKESSLNNDFKLSPAKLNCEYKQFRRKKSLPVTNTRPSLISILLVILFVTLFLILPLVYLLHCFGIIYIHHDFKNNYLHTTNKNSDYYEPSPKLRDNVRYYEVPSKIKTKALPDPPPPDYKQCKILKDEEKFDCYPENGATPDLCAKRGCCWIPAKTKPKNGAPLGIPYCFYPKDFNTYVYLNKTETAFGLVIFMKRNYRTAYPEDVEYLKIIVKYETEDRLHIKIKDVVNSRYESSLPEIPIVDRAASNLNYKFIINMIYPGFQIIRKSDNTIIFDTLNLRNMIYSNQFLQLSAKLPSKNIYGIGEHRSDFRLSTEWSRFTLFNHDMIPSENKNLYGSHPFYMVMEESGKSHGVFLLNSNAMDVILQPTPAITFRPIGGIFDFYFFLGPTPANVIQQYTDLVGRPQLPPYWGLGFHLCRFGYKTLDNTRAVMERNIAAGIPLDTQWNDLDYMNNSNDFTYDKVNFKGLPDFVKDLHKRGMHYIPLIDPGVSASEKPGTYPPFDIGISMNIFVKNSTDQPFIGKVWNKGSTVWPDFTHPTTVDYWTQMLKSLHDQIPFDGAWIDMNEPSNFLNGAYNGCPKNSLENPPYLPSIDGGVLNYKTMCMSSKHYSGLHYNVHNLFGSSEAIVTGFALAEIRGKRPMIISRSTFAGHGRYAGHWSGDVVSAWKDMKKTIPQLLSFSLFGVPLMGADICGFNGNTTASLCNRWMQLGAFYPFSRNHNTDDGIDQDPVALGDLVVASSKKALNIRYAFLPYLYTLFHDAHENGDTVSRPLLFEWPKDKNTYDIDTQFLWGSCLMIIPVLEENAQFASAYLPAATWYDYYSKEAVVGKGERYNISAPYNTIPLKLRGGCVVPMQEPKQTTTDSRKTKLQLLVTYDESHEAHGSLFWDDGDSLNTIEENKYNLIYFDLKEHSLTSINRRFQYPDMPNLGKVTVLGVPKAVKSVTVNENSTPFQFDTIHKILIVDNLNVSLSRHLVVSWSFGSG